MKKDTKNLSFAKVSLKDRIFYLNLGIFSTLILTNSTAIWNSEIGYYIQKVFRIITFIVFTIIFILNIIGLNRRLKNKKDLYNKKQTFKMIFGASIELITLILVIIANVKYI
ncbi:hypothetical protein RBU61_03605 [Tissierella sp. MB52-C2]|uniref:hypothetical protein n=1 Tax=Tissierella sp. MB52-C2 TaxID=3070999 RepID=UPI00280B89E4|nr:hypothetical protein [Tissierella sp. MB52-C2]WMM25766.1 hypothetical protein RBU61_03605 [Tissierella sp. MB52-C2]